jgi:hypothetical protein
MIAPAQGWKMGSFSQNERSTPEICSPRGTPLNPAIEGLSRLRLRRAAILLLNVKWVYLMK